MPSAVQAVRAPSVRTFHVRIRRALGDLSVYGPPPMESATTAGDRRSSIEPPRTSAQIEAEIGRLKRQTTRVVSPEHQRYRALLRESLLMEIARLEREKEHALRLEDQRRG